MESSGWKGPRFGLALLGAGILFSFAAQPAAAQNSVGVSRPADEVARNLRTLAANPRSVAALMGAGKASLAVGDAQAALSFFSRAEEQLPKDGRIKMWIGSALVHLEQPRPALKFFEEARRLGVPDAEMAGDRGLVHDMLGDPRRAQRDYELALRTAANPEITRRLALSYGISGERERALQLLEEQLLLRDPAAERTRAFILALTGDAPGAVRLTQAAMPGPAADAMAPFLTRLPTLSLAERAMAVHFGHFPGQGAASSASTYASLEPVTSAGAPDPRQPALGSGRPAARPVVTDTRRRPDAATATTSTILASTQAPPATPAASQAQPVQRRFEPPAEKPAAPPPQVVLAAREPEPQPRAPEPTQSSDEAESSRLADLAAALEGIEEEAPAPAKARPAATPSKPPARQAAATGTAQRDRASAATAKKPPAAPRETARVWVQVAGGANKSWLPREFARLKAKAPKLLGSRTAWSVPVGATNRLLVGPFANAREAQAFVNELAKVDIAGFAWTSAAGQKVERLAAR